MARGRTFPQRGSKRTTQWIGPADQGYVSVASATSVIVASFSPAAVGFTSPTIVRTRGMCSVIPTAFTADEDHIGAFGLGVVTDQAFAAGAASLPRVFDDADWGGWFVWRSFSWRMEFLSGTSVWLTDWSLEIDSKAMRKVGDNETIVLMAESQGGAFRVSAPLRVLLKLS